MVGIVLAASAAAAFGAGSSLQHRAARGVPRTNVSTIGLLLRLLRRRSWLLGILLSGAAFVLHVSALRYGSLTLIQAIVVSNIVFAVLVRAALDRRLPPPKEVAWVVSTWGGLALFIAMLDTHVALHPARSPALEVFVASAVVVTVLAVWCARRTHRAALRGFLLASAAGVLYGLTAGLIKVVLIQARVGWLAIVQHWSFWAVLAVGVNALLLSQRAYHAARMSRTVPILNIADVLVAIAFGLIVFGERVFASPGHLAGGLVGLVVMGFGVWQLARLEEEIELPALAATNASGLREPSSRP